MGNRWGNSGNSVRLYFSGLQNHCRWWLQPWNWKTLLGRKAMTNLDSILKSRDIILPTKVWWVKAMAFPVVMYGCENWTIKNAECWRIDAFALVLEKPFESPLDCKEIKPVNPKGNESWMFIRSTDVEAEAPILSPPDEKSWHIEKDPDAGKRLRANEAGNRRWAGWMASSIQWTWVWANFGR